jgi:hypothetical protein
MSGHNFQLTEKTAWHGTVILEDKLMTLKNQIGWKK